MSKWIPINPNVLKWARETSGYQLDELAKNFSKLDDWEQGKSYPTYTQLKTLAKHYKRPIAIFFFPAPPEEIPIEKSLRAVSEEDVQNLKPTIRFLFRKAKAFQIYLKELLADKHQEQINKLNWLKSDVRKTPAVLAHEIRNNFNITLETQNLWGSVDKALEEWRAILAQRGVYVFKDAFKDDRVSGFCIYDELFPIIYVNNSHSKSRQIFTIFHELAHLIFKQTYLDILDDVFLDLDNRHSNIEVKCNAFAGNFLVPDNDFFSRLSTKKYNASELEKIADFYKVSKEVILRKLLSNKLIDNSFYEKMVKEWQSNFDDKTKKKNGNGGGNYFYTKLAYLGDSYFSLVFERYYHGIISIERAAECLDVKVKTFSGLENAYFKRESSNVHI